MPAYPYSLPVYIRVGEHGDGPGECHVGDLEYGPEDNPARILPGFLRGAADIMDAGFTGQDSEWAGIIAGLDDTAPAGPGPGPGPGGVPVGAIRATLLRAGHIEAVCGPDGLLRFRATDAGDAPAGGAS
jgi:hypothetical protein